MEEVGMTTQESGQRLDKNVFCESRVYIKAPLCWILTSAYHSQFNFDCTECPQNDFNHGLIDLFYVLTAAESW